MEYIQKESRAQISFLPDCIEDYISQDNPVRVIDAFADSLDMKELGFKRSVPAATGRPAYDPRDLLKLYIYGYYNKIRSGRKQSLTALPSLKNSGFETTWKEISTPRFFNCSLMNPATRFAAPTGAVDLLTTRSERRIFRPMAWAASSN